MKLNGALKPRHGASIQGSSPGAGQLRKNGDKRYPQDTCTYALNGCLPPCQFERPQQRDQHLSACQVSSNTCITTDNSSNSDNYIWYAHPQLREHQVEQHCGRQEHQTFPQLERDETTHNNCQGAWPSKSEEEGILFMDITNTNTSQKWIKSVRTSIDSISHGSGQLTTASAKAVSEEPMRGKESYSKYTANTLKQQQQLYITTRQKTKTNNNKKPRGLGAQLPPRGSNLDPPRSANRNTNATNTHRRPRSRGWKEVNNKLLLVTTIYEVNFWCALPSLSAPIFRLFKSFWSFIFSLTSVMISIGSEVEGGGSGGSSPRDTDCSFSRGKNGERSCLLVAQYNCLANIMRASQSFVASLDRICFKNASNSSSTPATRSNTNTPAVTTATSTSSIAVCLLVYGAVATMLHPQPVLADEGDNFFSPNGIVIGETTTEFDYASRGQKKFGDKCDNTLECGFPGSICDTKKKSCQCTEDLPVTNHIDKCGKEAAVNESCFFNEQCEAKYFQTECRDGRCVCRFDMNPIWLKDGSVECKGRQDKKGPETYIDPAMIGVLIGMALMFIIICVVLRLFSQARWRENRTIFNTPNPRLMNVSLLRESKLLHGQERRGSRMSVRAPSRQPSMASLRPHSPNPSLGRMTRSKSNTRSSDSRVSDASNCSRLLEHSHSVNAHHHAQHPQANAASTGNATSNTIASHSGGIHSANVSPTPTAAMNYAIHSHATSTTCSTNIKPTLPPIVAIKPNKF
ncbi:uncharacterized protein LOC106087333 isoform X2 [Stomoxys calcitrans]|uniref:uncharacterized protein LOC106087333 isoform X2 n=1 Tax=Stomoxys calcitrans TaxID=35570 RepID=UPI0027E33633|nr:uncharacterized protein LOC106087333 isoform X2 [Stomoxys calcitrans]